MEQAGRLPHSLTWGSIRVWIALAAVIFLLSASALFTAGCSPSLPNLITAPSAGAKSGIFILNSSSGNIRIMGRMKRNKLNGPVMFFSKQGDTLGIIEYTDNARNGEARFWYNGKPAGKRRIKFLAHYSNDTLSGAKESYFPNGNLRSRSLYENGKLVSARAFDRSGRELSGIEARRQSSADRANDLLMFAEWNRFLTSKLQQND